jgi:AmmeMemoRadiSam system protein B
MALVAACLVAGKGMVGMSAAEEIRQAQGGGRWFPGSASALKASVEGYLTAAAVPAVTGRIVAAIAPHAGYPYSGPVAGFAFRAIRDNAASNGAPDVVVVLGFSHRQGFHGLALMDGDVLTTPMGKSALDRESAAALTSGTDRIYFRYGPHQGEHSAENEVPFVQAILPAAPLVVGLFGDHDGETLSTVVSALEKLARKKKVLVIASTDLLHDPDYDKVTRTDAVTVRRIAALDEEALVRSWSPHQQVCCGLMPVLAAVRFARAQGCAAGQVLRYRNSGDDHPESRGEWVVGYGAIVFAVRSEGAVAR